jgi:hypothetical protein
MTAMVEDEPGDHEHDNEAQPDAEANLAVLAPVRPAVIR